MSRRWKDHKFNGRKMSLSDGISYKAGARYVPKVAHVASTASGTFGVARVVNYFTRLVIQSDG